MTLNPRLNAIGIEIREATEQDQPSINAMDIAIYEIGDGVIMSIDELRQVQIEKADVRIPKVGDGILQVAVNHSLVVGQAALRRRTLVALSHVAGVDLSVHPEWQGKGIGRALMDTIMAWGLDPVNELSRIELQVRGDNHRAIALYESLGFQHEGRRINSFCFNDTFVDDISMALLLR